MCEKTKLGITIDVLCIGFIQYRQLRSIRGESYVRKLVRHFALGRFCL